MDFFCELLHCSTFFLIIIIIYLLFTFITLLLNRFYIPLYKSLRHILMLSFMRSVEFQRDSRARLVYSYRSNSTLVTEHLHKSFLLVGWPEGDCSIGVSEVDDGISRVLAHHVKPASLGADGCHLLSHRHIQVLQKTCSTLRSKNRNINMLLFS